MDDLISREELKKALRQRQWYIDDIEEVMKIIDNAQLVTLDMAQVLAYESGKASAEIPTGHWVVDDPRNLIWHCSECRNTNTEYRFPFCPWCGAKMN